MGNLFVNLPMPAFDGPGASVATAQMGRDKTLVVVGTFVGATITIEASVDGGVVFAPLATFATGANKTVVSAAASHLRVNVSGRSVPVPFSADADVAANDDGALFISLPLPPGSGAAGNGAGAAVPASQLGSFTTFIAGGIFTGASIQVQVSEDGVAWAPSVSFSGSEAIQSKDTTAAFYRLFVSGRTNNSAFVGVSVAAGSINNPITGNNALPPFPSPPVPRIITIFARTTGSDTAGNGTLANPYATMQRAVRDVPMLIPAGFNYVVDITGITEVLPTDYTLPAWKSPYLFLGDAALPPFFIFTNVGVSIQATPRLVASISAADATVAPAATGVTGSGDALAIVGTTVTLTDAAGLFTTDMIGLSVVTTLSGDPLNNGTFVITGATPTTLTYTDLTPGASEPVWPGTWTIAGQQAQIGSGLILLTIATPRASWGANALKGKFLVGANALENSTIIASTATTLLVARSTALTGTLQIMEPSAELICTRTATAGTVNGGFGVKNVDSIALNGLKITTPQAAAFALELGGSVASAVQMCELESPLVTNYTAQCTRNICLWIYGDNVRYAGSYALAQSFIDAPTLLQFSALGPANIGMRNIGVVGGPGLRICQGQFPGQAVVANAPATFFVAENILIANCLGAAIDGIRFHGTRGIVRNADIRGNGRDGIRMETGSGLMELFNVRSTVANGVSAAGTSGVNITDGMVCKVDAATSAAAPAGTNLRGSSVVAEMKVGPTSAGRTWADFISGASGRPALNEYDLFAVAGAGGTFTNNPAAVASYVSGTGTRLFQ